MRKSLYLATTIALGLVAFADCRAQAATDIWNYSTTPWETPSAWTPAGPPTNADLAEFTSFFGTLSALVSLNQPVINSSDVAQALIVGNNYQGGGVTFTGAGSLTLGTPAAGSTTAIAGALTTVGSGTYTFNGPTLLGLNATTLASVNVGGNSTLSLAGATTATTANFVGTLSLQGNMILDNRATDTAGRILGDTLSFSGGTLSYYANAASTTQVVGSPTFNNGANTVLVYQPGGATGTAQLNFTIAAAKSLRTTTGYLDFVATNVLPGTSGTNTAVLGATGTEISFTNTPTYNSTNFLLAGSTSATTRTFGFAIETDANGTNYAAINPTGNYIVAATPTVNSANVAAFSSTGTNTLQVVQYSPTASETAAASSTLQGGVVRISPTTSGLTLSLGADASNFQALMLDGIYDYSITGTSATGFLGTGATRYIYVNNPNTTLSTDEIIGVATSGVPTIYAGPGFLNLIGTASQNTSTSTNALNLVGGVLRANNVQIGLTTAGGSILAFRGGVLEIKDGSNGTGSSADFTRTLATTTATAGTVSFNAGGGGFSAYNSDGTAAHSAASVNIGGSGASLQYTDGTAAATLAGFIPSGAPLLFGSTQSNARLNFLNGLNLTTVTTTSTGNYAERQINVTANSADTGTSNAGDFTDIQGVISGNANSDLLKTGTGVLQLSGVNTYSGNTIVNGGTLVAASSAATGTGAVLVNNGGSLGAAPGGGTVGTVILNSGGVIKPNVAIVGGTGATTLTVSSALTLNGGTIGSTIAGYSWTLGADFINASGATFDANVSNTTFNFTSGAANGTYNLISYSTLGNGLSNGTIGSHFTATGDTGTFALNNNILQFIVGGGSSAMPEPGTFALVAVGLLPFAGILRKRRSDTDSVNWSLRSE